MIHKKKIVKATVLAVTVLLGACSEKHGAEDADNARHPLFYKSTASDKQMTQDLNECARDAFRDGSGASDVYLKRKCMTDKGYEVFYN